MTAACAAIWLADNSRCADIGGDGCATPRPRCDRFDVEVDGSVESNMPAFCECFLECPLPPRNVLVTGDALPRGVLAPGIDGNAKGDEDP
jgi:hypothetical protein